jgi:hypothetical protein
MKINMKEPPISAYHETTGMLYSARIPEPDERLEACTRCGSRLSGTNRELPGLLDSKHRQARSMIDDDNSRDQLFTWPRHYRDPRCDEDEFSPRVWGWSGHGTKGAPGENVFPTRVGWCSAVGEAPAEPNRSKEIAASVPELQVAAVPHSNRSYFSRILACCILME